MLHANKQQTGCEAHFLNSTISTIQTRFLDFSKSPNEFYFTWDSSHETLFVFESANLSKDCPRFTFLLPCCPMISCACLDFMVGLPHLHLELVELKTDKSSKPLLLFCRKTTWLLEDQQSKKIKTFMCLCHYTGTYVFL